MRHSLLLTVALGLLFLASADLPSNLVASFNWLNFTFPSSIAANEYINNQYYKNCMLAGVKVSMTGEIFVSVPRWKPFVPATLNKLVPNEFLDDGIGPYSGPYLLQPFPSWMANEPGDSTALQSVLGFEIDSCNRIWVLDQGKVAGAAALPGSIKLVVYNATSGVELVRYVFPETQASLTHSFLNDLVIDQINQFAYITDSGIPINSSLPTKGGLIVFNYTAAVLGLPSSQVSWRVLDSTTPVQAVTSLWITINGDKVLSSSPMMTGADGIALTPDTTTLVFCPLTSEINYVIPTALLRSQSTISQQDVYSTGSKSTSTDGLSIDNDGVIYVSALEMNGLLASKSPTAQPAQYELIVSNDSEMVWPDTLAWDHKGNLVFTSNQLYKFVEDQLDFTETNFRIWSVYIGEQVDSYLAATASTAQQHCSFY